MSGLTLGSVRGISLRIDSSWLLIFFVVAWSAAAYFPRALPGMVGPTEALVLKSVLVARQQSGSRMPDAQAAILGLSEMLPSAADAVLSRARRYYDSPPLS